MFVRRLLAASFILGCMSALPASAAQSVAPAISAAQTTRYKTVDVKGLNIFYREAGSPSAPTILLLHGFPSSSRMFDGLIPLLADHYHLIAPDYPGFGNSQAPSPKEFAYTFAAIADVVAAFTEALHLDRYALYVQDYGGPVGYRIAVSHPERVTALIVQNAVAHDEGLGRLSAARKGFWVDRAANEADYRTRLTSVEVSRRRHLGSSPNTERYDPDLWNDEVAFLSRPGEADIQSDLFYDYRTNLAAYPVWQAWLREHHPPTLIVWGRYDPAFDIAEVAALKRDVPDAEVHVLDAGHFALDEAADDIARLMRDFLAKVPANSRP
ncbi:alpha/beta fold hydrolase [Bradyrhizobium sp.]|uniref:alpha/beta fold hydrolase n=1 Tax=Bradyrhizobium sp. TaxID=376 RepID=UPI0025C561DC|nr:alpha/beta hydrolase [Bradyrhizobium sp.]